MEQAILSDKTQFPTEKIISSHLGKSRKLWDSLFDFIHQNYPEITSEWRYYNDGKSWLMKVTKKAKTIFWLQLYQNSFRTTFYFTDKAKDLIIKSSISDELKDHFINGKRFGKISGLSIIYKSKKDIENVKSLIEIKLAIK